MPKRLSTQKYSRRRCPEGERLHREWLEALATHDHEIIFQAMRAYFFHLNGAAKYDGCYECWEMAREKEKIA
jgi:hypothetical protein